MKNLLEKQGFTPIEISDFIANATHIQCPKKTVLLKEGDISRTFYYAQKGIFRAGFTDRNDNQLTRAFFSPTRSPFVMSYTSFIFQRPSLSFLDALEDGELFAWDYDYMIQLQENNVKWALFLREQLDFVFSAREIKEWQAYMLTAEERYLAFLEQFPELAHQIPLHYIASYIGITPEALSRIRRRLAKNK